MRLTAEAHGIFAISATPFTDGAGPRSSVSHVYPSGRPPAEVADG